MVFHFEGLLAIIGGFSLFQVNIGVIAMWFMLVLFYFISLEIARNILILNSHVVGKREGAMASWVYVVSRKRDGIGGNSCVPFMG